MRWVIAATASCVGFYTVAAGTFVPLRGRDGIEYLFAWPGGWNVVWASAALLIIVCSAYAVVAIAAKRFATDAAAEARAGRWLAPLSALGFSVLGILPAVPRIGERAAVLAYLFHDLRWWWFAVVVGLTALGAERLVGSPLTRRVRAIAQWSTASRLLLLDGFIFTTVVVWAVVSTPELRWNG